ncbi:hypothetical protein DPMN_128160 [Dreissena polymorpha]|uniref:Uncharacterized protein n=1 Tax=Dreissena polymorpha TaxID=45954 RepID=A0A9D4JX55_DREPO|nr:hypothetical protein DPMN_128160 [Dreissena polymorpha]
MLPSGNFNQRLYNRVLLVHRAWVTAVVAVMAATEEEAAVVVVASVGWEPDAAAKKGATVETARMERMCFCLELRVEGEAGLPAGDEAKEEDAGAISALTARMGRMDTDPWTLTALTFEYIAFIDLNNAMHISEKF